MNTVDAALDYLHRGWLPIPLCWPDAQGRCACGHNPPHEGRDIAKAPLLSKGYQDVHPTEADLRRWWQRWPKANVGILLEPSGLLVVDCDSEQALQEALSRGLPPGPIVATGKGSHYYYHANGAAGRTTKQGEHHALDVLARGYVVAPPSLHREGRHYEWNLHPDDAEPQDAPAWAVAMLAKPDPQTASPATDDDAPPVRLDGKGADLWAGRAAVDRADGKLKSAPEVGELDRSETLYAIGCRLATAGATKGTIVKALADRDRALGLDKYADRQDGGAAEYARIADKALAEVPSSNGHETAQQNCAAHYRHTPCAAQFSQLREVDAAELAKAGAPEEPPSLPLLGQDGYIIEHWGHILAGYPKAGKTELLFACVRQWLNDGLAVLWLSEESQAVWQQRLSRYPDFPAGLRLVFAIGVEPGMLLARAESGTEQVVVVDTIRNLLQIRDENDNSAVSAALLPWEAALSNRTRIYVHHQRKMGGDHGQAIAGGGAFLGVVDRAIELQFDSHEKKRRQLVVHSRIVEAPDLLYELADDGLKALGEPDEVAAGEVQARALDVLNGEWQKSKEVHEALDEPKPSLRQVQLALKALHSAGKAERDPAEDKHGATYHWRASLKTALRTGTYIGLRSSQFQTDAEHAWDALLESDAPPDDGDEPTTGPPCVDCGAALPPGRRYRCQRCAEVAANG